MFYKHFSICFKQIKIDLFLYISKEQRRKKSCLVIVSRRVIFFSRKMLKARVEVRERNRAPYNDRTEISNKNRVSESVLRNRNETYINIKILIC